jgi:hypothetical protein
MTPLTALSQVIMGSIAKFATDLGYTSSEIIAVIAGRQHPKDSAVDTDVITREILTASENPESFAAHAPSLLTAAHDPAHKWSYRHANSQQKMGYASRSALLLHNVAARTNRLAQGALDIIIVPPMEIFCTVSRGFHNVPLVLHDDTARDIPKVSGLQSGIKAAGKVIFRQHSCFLTVFASC